MTGTVVVTAEGVGKTKSGNEPTGRSVWLYKVKDGNPMERRVLRGHRPGARRARLTGYRGRSGSTEPLRT